ncbi:hypothetical protein [Nannocystis pusilla]|uniref:hypothetical protein n=1 Tax=Nannocystis pusilla TaxID=889268 RepID=UPI003B7E4C8B
MQLGREAEAAAAFRAGLAGDGESDVYSRLRVELANAVKIRKSARACSATPRRPAATSSPLRPPSCSRSRPRTNMIRAVAYAIE